MSENDDGGDWFEEALDEESSDSETSSETTDADDGFDASVFGDSETDSAVRDSETDAGTGDDATDTTVSDGERETGFSASDAFSGSERDDSGPATGDEDGAFGGGESVFDDDFESAFGGSDDSEFDEEAFESSIPRIDLGIEGLDDMIQGGVPERHLMTAIGSAGTGKTTFGLQFLQHGLQQGDNGVFITLEQSREAIVATADDWGWEFTEYEDRDMLAIVDLDPVEMANSLDNIRGELPELIRDFDADRLVLDSVSLLEMMYEDQARRRTEVFDFTRSLKQAGVTTFLTSEASESNPYASRHGIIEYLTDAVFVLQYVRGETQETRLAVEIQKIRNTNHSREKKPYEITPEGLSVYQQANIF